MAPGVPIALALGLLGSLHCVAMCGGIVGVLAAGPSPNLRRRPSVGLRFVAAYNLGRVGSYGLVGAVLGSLSASVAHRVAEGQLVLRIAAGTLTVLVGLSFTGLLPAAWSIERVAAPVWRPVARVARRLLPVPSLGRAFALGALWGWIPCGMVYGALAIATASGGAAVAAEAMVAFGLGTLPAMFAAGTIAGHAAAAARGAWVRRGAGLAVAALGAVTVTSAVPMPLPGAAHAGTAACHSHVYDGR